jgi:hypothetical protein
LKTVAAIAIILALFATLPSHADAPLSATLTIAPTHVLPGLPAAFLVAVKNTSDHVQSVVSVSMRAIGSDGEFEPKNMLGQAVDGLPKDQTERCGEARCFNIPALGSRQMFIEAWGNGLLDDGRFTIPGSYQIELTLHVIAADGSDLPVVTALASLIVDQPTGVDADAWGWLLQQNGGKPWTILAWGLHGQSVIADLHAKFPQSRYSVWTAPLGASSLEQYLINLDVALDTNAEPSLRDMLLWAKGSALVAANAEAIHLKRDLQLALSLADEATKTLTTLGKLTIVDALRDRAVGAIARLYTSTTGAATLRQLAESDLPAPIALIPRVDCVSPGKGSAFIARFGYTNPNKALKVIELSDRNQITPAPRDQGQPRVFKPGDHASVLTASSPGGELKWHLDGSQATATADYPVQCAVKP